MVREFIQVSERAALTLPGGAFGCVRESRHVFYRWQNLPELTQLPVGKAMLYTGNTPDAAASG